MVLSAAVPRDFAVFLKAVSGKAGGYGGAASLLFHEGAAADGKRLSLWLSPDFAFIHLDVYPPPHIVCESPFQPSHLHLLCLCQEEQAAKLKAERIRVALEKIKEAQVKKV